MNVRYAFAKTKGENYGEQKQVYVHDGGDRLQFLCPEKYLVRPIQEKIHFGPFQVLFDNINAKLRFVYVGGLLLFLIATKQSILV